MTTWTPATKQAEGWTTVTKQAESWNCEDGADVEIWNHDNCDRNAGHTFDGAEFDTFDDQAFDVNQRWEVWTPAASETDVWTVRTGDDEDVPLGWTLQTIAGTHGWTDATISSDGTKIALVDLNDGGGTGSVWTSTDSGANWTERTLAGSHQWQAVSMSSDGNFIAACWFDSAIDEGVAYSSDGGTTWNTNTVAGAVGLNSIAVSGDGTIIVTSDPSGVGGGAIYLSTDSGVTFAASVGAGNHVWREVWVSRDGSLIIVVGDDVVMVSTDTGTSWTDRTPSADSWDGVATSSDGSKVALCMDTGVFYSSDSGVSFTELPSTTTFFTYRVSISDDGATMLIPGDATGNMMLSDDSGSTWATQDPPGIGNWAVAISSDGTKAVAAEFGGAIWTGSL